MNAPSHFARTAATALALMACAVAFPAMAAGSGNASKEIATATEHAGYAAEGKNVKAVHTHLHHVLNCLVGENDDDYNAKAGNPCKGQGNGAKNDYQGSEQMKDVLDEAEDVAELGLKMNSLKPAQHIAKAVQEMLQGVQAQ